MALERPLDTLTEADLEELVCDAVSEGKFLEYKDRITIGTEAERKEFLADVFSFANSSGGDLVFGVVEHGGVATALKPVEAPDIDAVKLTLENIVRDGIAPRMAVSIAAIPVRAGHVLVLRIPASWGMPHMVTFKGHGRFYARNSAGKYAPDVGELRYAFTATSGAEERAREFRSSRIATIITGNTPVGLISDTPN